MSKYQGGNNNNVVANDRIKFKELRVMDSDNEQIGIMSKAEALNKARSQGLDLVLVTDRGNPPVARIVNLNKYNYELKKREKEQAKKARANAVDIKEIKLRPGIGEHDFEIKLNKAKKFLEKGAKVKITIQLRGREMTKGKDVVDYFTNGIAAKLDGFKYEQELNQTGNRITGVIVKDG